MVALHEAAARPRNVFTRHDLHHDTVIDCDVVVVGSGAGGAPIAAELAEAGFDVVVLEEGAYYQTRDFTADTSQMVRQLYRDGGATIAIGNPPIMFQEGRAVGGSTVINGGMSWRTPDDILARWRDEAGLADLTPAQLEPYYERVERRIHVAPMDEDAIGNDNWLLKKGADAMGWKEQYAPESAWLARLSLLVGVGLVAYSVRFQFFGDPQFLNYVFDEMFTYGLDIGPRGAHGVQRSGLNYVLCENAAILFTASLVASTLLAASSIAGERARGTWPGLLGTPLKRREILRAKMWGAVRPVRVLLGLMLLFYITSMAATALHPLGFVMVVTVIAVFLWLAVAMGVWVSARSNNATQAIGRTVLLLVAFDLAPVAAVSPFLGPRSIAISMPVFLMYLPISRMQFRNISQVFSAQPSATLPFLLLLVIVLAHALGAWLLTRAAARRIERDEG